MNEQIDQARRMGYRVYQPFEPDAYGGSFAGWVALDPGGDEIMIPADVPHDPTGGALDERDAWAAVVRHMEENDR